MLRLIERGSFEEAARVRLSGDLALELQTCLGDYVMYVMEREVRSARFVDSVRSLPQPVVSSLPDTAEIGVET
jgi:hypothetical protein